MTLWRLLCLWAAAGAFWVANASEPVFPFAEATIDDLQARMAAGTLSAHELTAAYLGRIAEIDKAGPKINAVIELNPEALDIADRLDAERKAHKLRGPLHGIPILIKDNIGTTDRMETTAGSLALVGAKPPREAHLVTRLRDAGAVILGKTNLSEWANFRSTSPTSGWSGRGGQTLNPYALDRNPSGSSSGSAVAVSANLCVVAVGTETDGSIVSPSSVCGIVGLKPTVGLVSRAGIIPISVSQDTAGPMARTVRDAAILLEVLAEVDSDDAVTQTQPPTLAEHFAAALKSGVLKNARIGIVHGPFHLHPRMEAVLSEMVAVLRDAGAEVIDPIEIPVLNDIGKEEEVVLDYEFRDGINAWFTSLGQRAPVKSLAELIVFNSAHRAQEMPVFAQEILVRAQARGQLTDKVYLDAHAASVRLARIEGIDAVMEKNRLDAIVAITSGPAWLIDPVNGDQWTGDSTTLAAVAGCPSVTVPAAYISGLPIGLSFFGRAWTEAKLLALASDFEARTHARHEPRFLPTIKMP